MFTKDLCVCKMFVLCDGELYNYIYIYCMLCAFDLYSKSIAFFFFSNALELDALCVYVCNVNVCAVCVRCLFPSFCEGFFSLFSS